MIILNCNNISLSFGENTILDNVSLSIQDTDKIGIVGVNGAGKSTLLKIINGELKPENGEVSFIGSRKLGYLTQDSNLNPESTIWNELLLGFSDLVKMENRINELNILISNEKDQEKLSSLIKELDSTSEKFSRLGGYEYNSRIRGVLRGLGFSDDEFSSRINTLSGGQKTRLSLAKLLLNEPDILLLDEPTNHLDLIALEWLEGFLKSYSKCVIVISHDRYFLDAVTNKIIEIENNEATAYARNYSEYVLKKAELRENQQKEYELYLKETERMEKIIEQYKRFNREKSIKAAESRQKALDRMEKVDKPENLPGKIKLRFQAKTASGKEVIQACGLTKGYPNHPLFNDVNFTVRRSDKVFLLGPNGCGKSTLLKVLTSRLEKGSGSFELGHNVKIGYYDQHQEGINLNNTVLDEIYDANPNLTQTQLRSALAAFLFRGDDVFKQISVLSGGERSRLALLKLMLSETNLLILDEPTNHLDINSREILENALEDYNGTILAVSHDRYFIKKLATRIFEISDCTLKDYSYGYLEYVDSKRSESKNVSSGQNKVSTSKLERQNAKEEEARKRKLAKQLKQTEEEIANAEERLKRIDEEMKKEEVISDHVLLSELFSEQSSLKSKLEDLYVLWEELESQSAE